MNPYFVRTAAPPGLKAPLQAWMRRHSGWALRWDQEQQGWRNSTTEEVVAALVEDPTFQQVLAGLSSPVGQALEKAVLSQWMTPAEAALMTDALTKAWKYVRNQTVPIWKRSEVIVGALIVVAVIVGGIVVVRHVKSKR